ncbi:MAG: ABC transporter ATP-binding protein/permease [Bacteroides sp.]|nr:ABC transporter ATP-binding protein/permease [Eubacterium sp.]MCM1417589.1 ABC transporter ATP-binding protein/permease [Roseburia sp.]MCM1461700.1 ABC transporter ATP-binding protein/permease [Bacteroides sp.]
MKKLLKYLTGDYLRETILSPLFKMLEALLELFVPIVVAAIIDRGIGDADGGYVVKMCLILGALGLVGLGFSITAQYFAAKAAAGFAKNVGHALFSHIQSLSYADLDEAGSSTLITRMTSDLNQVQSGVNMTLRLLLRSPFVVFGAMVMAFTIDASSALVFVATIPVLAAIVFVIMLVGIPMYNKVRERLDRVLGRTRENLTGVRVIRAFCKEPDEIAAFDAENRALTDEQKAAGRVSALTNPLTLAVVNIAIVILIHIGALRVDAGILTQGSVVALYNYMSQILVELIKLANLILNITKSVACGKRIEAAIESGEGMTDGAERNGFEGYRYAFELRDASLKYRGAAENALTKISLAAERGSTVGIIGGTGSGKSSVVNLIPRFYDATEGGVFVDGLNVKDYAVDALRSRIGVVPQKAALFHGTIRDNLRWGNEDATDEELMEAVALAQATEVVEGKEDGLGFMIEQGGRNLSGGQRQRLTIARALVKKPKILILDDSASALDLATDAALRGALRSLTDVTTVIVSQRTSSIRHADQILVLDDGEAAGIGTHDELLKTCGIYREIYESQYKTEEGKERKEV